MPRMDKRPHDKLSLSISRFEKQRESSNKLKDGLETFNLVSPRKSETIDCSTRVMIGDRNGIVLDVTDDEILVELDDGPIPEIRSCRRSEITRICRTNNKIIDALIYHYFLITRTILCQISSCSTRSDSDDPKRTYFFGFAKQIIPVTADVDSFIAKGKLFYESPSRVKMLPSGSLSTERDYDETPLPENTVLLAQVKCSITYDKNSKSHKYRIFCDRWAIATVNIRKQYLQALDVYTLKSQSVQASTGLDRTWVQLSPEERQKYKEIFWTPQTSSA